MSKYYLIAYNFIALIFWTLYVVAFFSMQCKLTEQCLWLLNIAQGLAILEVAHAALRLVKSPVGSTVAQVASRILVLVLINLFIADATNAVFYAGLVMVSFAWGVTEIIRYGHYFLMLLHRENDAIIWMRYSFFIVLYPIGVTGEWLIIAYPLVRDGLALNFYTAMVVGLAIAYIYYFPVLYKYMWSQRRKKLTPVAA